MIRTTDGDNREKKKKKKRELYYNISMVKPHRLVHFSYLSLKMHWKIERLSSLFGKYLSDTGDALNTVRLLPLAPKIEKKILF